MKRRGDSLWRIAWAAVRQALVGVVVVVASVPLLMGLCRALELEAPPVEGVALLGGSVLLGFAGGGVIGALLGGLAGSGPLGRVRLAAALAGLVWGGLLCSVALPLYTDSVMDDVTDAGTEQAIARVGPVLERPSGAADQAVDAGEKLAMAAAARLPALALLGWTLLGPAVVAPLEVRRRK
ncbi:MAG: hypothetical protein JO250_16645 [Armatimonadetes bacterium]|nr:hypothetical protein [Armatimonadota bacterium]